LGVRGVTAEALRRLAEHPWRGNVRELEAVLEEAMIFRRGEWIGPEDLDLSTSRAEDVVNHVGATDHGDAPAMNDELSWLQREALRLAFRRRELRRRELVERCGVSREVAHRGLTGLVRLGLLRRIGSGRGARYVPLSLWLTWMSEALEWALALV
jgi:DNA-binding NtrC family response regulator